MLNSLYRFLVSLSTVFWSFALLLGLMLVGSLMLPENLAFFSGIDDEPLFRWLLANAEITKVWWIWALVAGIAWLGLSTVLCTLDFLRTRLSRVRFLLRVTPQVMHLGVLFVMLGHLLTGSYGFKTDYMVRKGDPIEPLENIRLTLENLDLTLDELGLAADWRADLRLEEQGQSVTRQIRPAGPVYFGGLGFYFKSVAMEEEPVAVLRICRDPGAPWALAGGILLIMGGTAFLYARFRKSEA